MASEQTGQIKLVAIEAKLTRDTEFIGKMDPYLILETSTQSLRTKILDGAGKTPKWNQEFVLNVTQPTDVLKVRCMDDDGGNDDTVG